MPKRVLIDTNILIDMALPDRPEHEVALMLLDEVAYSGLDIHIAAPSLKDAYYLLTKCSSEPDARAYIRQALKVFEVLAVDAAICQLAAHSNEPDFEDGIIRACAELADVDFIISRDEAAFQRSPVKRLTAREYLCAFCGAHEMKLP